MTTPTLDMFRVAGRVAVITGGAGLLGVEHAEALASGGSHVVLVDIDESRARTVASRIAERHGVRALADCADITNEEAVSGLLDRVLTEFGRVDILVNNAANNPSIGDRSPQWSRLENFSLEQWHADIAVGLTGAFLCARTIGAEMARRGSGVIVNVASDLAVIAPDQRIYRQPEIGENEQPVKPVSYSVVKTALIGLTRYLATYWAHKGVRVNAISPGGVRQSQPEDFVGRLSSLIPLGRMASADEYRAALLFLCSDASSYMTGANLIVDGGRSVW